MLVAAIFSLKPPSAFLSSPFVPLCRSSRLLEHPSRPPCAFSRRFPWQCAPAWHEYWRKGRAWRLCFSFRALVSLSGGCETVWRTWQMGSWLAHTAPSNFPNVDRVVCTSTQSIVRSFRTCRTARLLSSKRMPAPRCLRDTRHDDGQSPCLPAVQPRTPKACSATCAGNASSGVDMVSFQRFRNPNIATTPSISTISVSLQCLRSCVN